MNLRTVKKDVEYFVNEFINDAFISISFSEDEEKKSGIVELVNKALDLRDDTIRKINNPDKTETKRAYYNHVMQELFSGLDAMYTELSRETRANGKGQTA